MDNFVFAGLTVNVFEFFDKVGVMRSREITGNTVANGINGILVDKFVVDDFLLGLWKKFDLVGSESDVCVAKCVVARIVFLETVDEGGYEIFEKFASDTSEIFKGSVYPFVGGSFDLAIST
jgi:hypothetical protein